MDTPMKIVMKIASVLLIMVFSVFADAATEVGGLLQSNTTWTAGKSPYLITDDFIVKENVTLTIEAGTQIMVNTGIRFLVNGKIIMNGTGSSPVVFSGQAGYNFEGAWTGIEVSEVYGASISAAYVEVRFAESGIIINSRTGNSVSNCLFESNTYGISGNGFIEISDSKFLNNYAGVNILNKKINRCIFNNNTTGISNLSEGINVVENSELINNSTGLFNASKSIEIRNTVFTKNLIGFETVSTGKDSNTVTGNSFCFNTSWNVKVNGSNNLNFSGNCWCSENDKEIAEKIYDKGEKSSLGKAEINSMNCGDLSSYGIFRITGTVKAGLALLQNGVVLLYRSAYDPPVSWTAIKNGKYSFWSVEPAYYFTYVIPDPVVYPQYLPAFQGDVSEWQNVNGQFISDETNIPDIHLVQITPETSGSILYKGRVSYRFSSDVGTVYQKAWFRDKIDQSDISTPVFKVPVFLHNEQGQVVNWLLTDSLGYFQFKGVGLNYYITVQRPGSLLNPSTGSFNNQTLTNFYLGEEIVAGNFKHSDYPETFNQCVLKAGDLVSVAGVEVINSMGVMVFKVSGKDFAQPDFVENLGSGIFIVRIFKSNRTEIVRLLKP
jgi:hypothetical protein